jgi:DNA-binding MarR family transcriptional regulator
MSKIIEINHEDAVMRAFMLFVQTARAVDKYSDSRFFRALNLSTVKYIALKALALSGGMLTHGDLAAWTGTERNNITALVKRMKEEGLITTEHSDDDRRFIKVMLTEKGRDLARQANPVARGVINEVMSGIGKREAAQMERLLRVLRKNTEKLRKE